MNYQFLDDEEKVSLSSDALLDRIINLKLKIKDKVSDKLVDEFVIRSDYEIVDTSNNLYGIKSNNVIIRKCTYKPSIKLQYKMLTANTGAEIDLFVSNFFIFTSDGKHLRNFDAKKYAIDSVEIAVGYFSQFCLPFGRMPTVEEYFNIDAVNGADKILIREITLVTTDKLPPDYTLHIHGIVGNVLSSPVGESRINNYEQASLKPTASSSSDLSKILYEQITKRYRKPDHISFRTMQRLSSALEQDSMTDLEAKENGVQVYLSKGAESIKIDKKLDSEGKPYDSIVYFESGFTLGQTIARIISSMGVKLEYRITNQGDILVFLTEEANDIDELHEYFNKDLYSKTTFTRMYKNRLPAVYNINIDVLATIVCPFFTFIEPFEMLEFSSRYSLSTITSYMANYDPTISQFLALKVSISFATVENVNEVTIVARAVKSNEEKM